MDKEENEDGTERQKEISFSILEVKRNHYDKKDLITIAMRIDDKEYEMSFLIDKYNTTFFPEFKELDKYGGLGGFKEIHNFLQSVNSKIQYYSEIHMKESKKGDFNTYEREWWMEDKKKDTSSDTDERFNEWVKKNLDYLIQYDFSKFDNDMIEEVIEYLKIREEFVQPGFIKVSLEEEEDIFSLREMLNNAVEVEDFEEAVKIREKIKNIK